MQQAKVFPHDSEKACVEGYGRFVSISGQCSAHLLAEIDFLAHINDGHLLGGGDYDSSIYIGSLQELGYGNMLV